MYLCYGVCTINEKQIFNLIAREEAAANIELAKDSRTLTNASVELAKDSRTIAVATMRDSSAMKTIAIVTMTFLPATFFAALFALPIFRWDETPVLQSRFWVYWAFTIPFTALVFAIWYTTTSISEKKNCLDNQKQREEIMRKASMIGQDSAQSTGSVREKAVGALTDRKKWLQRKLQNRKKEDATALLGINV